VRIEQLYPFPEEQYDGVLGRYANAQEFVWCQEEPQNQGAWFQIRHRLKRSLGERRDIFYAGRRPAAAPATGIAKIHEQEQQTLVAAALHAQVRDGGFGNTSDTARVLVDQELLRKSAS
jgi:2-oxoglutarate dehydrogenase E1 component